MSSKKPIWLSGAALVVILACGPAALETLDAVTASDAAAQVPTYSEASCVEVESSTTVTTLPRLSGGTIVTTQTVQLFGYTWTGEPSSWRVRRTPAVATDGVTHRCVSGGSSSCVRSPILEDAFELTYAHEMSFPLSDGANGLFASCGSRTARVIETFNGDGTLQASNEDPAVEQRFRVWTAQIR